MGYRDEQLLIYDALFDQIERFERKGKTMPYTSANGYMFSLLNKDGEFGIRLDKKVGAAFKEEHETTIFKSHGAVMKDYVLVPDRIFHNKEVMVTYLNDSFDYVMTLLLRKSNSMKELLSEISACTLCSEHLPLGPRPVLTATPTSKIVIIGQAPGTAVHKSGIPWDDKSGKNLRDWMGVSDEQFYDTEQIAIIPMGFCYPGRGKSGDLPPRKECATKWHPQLFEKLKNAELILLIGTYAQAYYLTDKKKKTLTETVRNFHEYLPSQFVLPHPSPRNNIWQAKNSWFKSEVLPVLKLRVAEILGDSNQQKNTL